MPPIHVLIRGNFLIDLVYSLVIMVSSLMIFLKTREIYQLSNHKGIKYFRMAFLFFSLTFFIRVFPKLLMILPVTPASRAQMQSYALLTSLLFLYSAIMTIFYLLYGISIGRLNGLLPKTTDILHVIAMLLSTAIVLLNMPIILVIIALGLAGYMVFLLYSGYIKPRKKELPKFYAIYFLLLVFTTLNIVDILVPNFFRGAQQMIYVASISLFLVILYKVMRILDVKPSEKRRKKK